MIELTDTEELSARLTVHEFILEVAMANQFATWTDAESESFRGDLAARMAKSYGPITGDPDTALRMRAIAERSQQLMSRLVDKAHRREIEIRARISRAP